jgi:hypothetical protein
MTFYSLNSFERMHFRKLRESSRFLLAHNDARRLLYCNNQLFSDPIKT